MNLSNKKVYICSASDLKIDYESDSVLEAITHSGEYMLEPYKLEISVKVEEYLYKMIKDKVSNFRFSPLTEVFRPSSAFLHIACQLNQKWYVLSLSRYDELIYISEVELRENRTLAWREKNGKIRAWIWSEPKGLVEILLNVAKKNKIKYLFYLRTYRNIEGG